MGFNSRPFILGARPERKPAAGEMLYEWRNGDFVLQISGHPNHGLPFGQDHIVPIYLTTCPQQNQTIRFPHCLRNTGDATVLARAIGSDISFPAGISMAVLGHDDIAAGSVEL